MYDSKHIAFILTSLEAIEKLKIYTKGIGSADALLEAQDQMVYNACLTLLMTIGEEVNKMDDRLKAEYPDVPWQNIKGLRNRIAHDYRGMDPTVPFSVIKNFLDPLKENLVQMLTRVDYSREKLERILQSPFYKHLSYLQQ